jgi:hypothetical protein
MPGATRRTLRSIGCCESLAPRSGTAAALSAGVRDASTAMLAAAESLGMLSASAAMEAAPRARTDADMMAIFFMPHQRRRSALVPALARGTSPETVPDASSRSVVSRRVRASFRSLFRCLRCVFGKAASRRMKGLLQAQSLPSFRAAILPCGRFGRVVAVSGRLSFFDDQS